MSCACRTKWPTPHLSPASGTAPMQAPQQDTRWQAGAESPHAIAAGSSTYKDSYDLNHPYPRHRGRGAVPAHAHTNGRNHRHGHPCRGDPVRSDLGCAVPRSDKRPQPQDLTAMTQILTPFRDRLRSLKDARDNGAGYRHRLCWTCQKDKPKTGGSYPDRKIGTDKGSKPDERFRCGDCTDARFARLALKAQDETRAS